jgi:hypothetical protein
MKSKILSSVIGAAGLAGLVGTSYGQGAIFFDNYGATPYYPIVYFGSGNLAGADVSAELGYALGANQTAGFTLIPSSITAVNAQTPGYFEGPVVIIPNYTSGPITFEILAWTTDGGTTFANSPYSNYWFPTIWTEPSISLLPAPAGDFTALPGNIVILPEPSALALAGLGAMVSLVAFCRRQS